MASDPAILFYTSDFLTGTFTMTNEQVGMYVRLLCLQHQKGSLSEKDMINVCGTYVEEVFLKFKKNGDKFYNERLREEAEKRKNFCESRRLSRQGSGNKKDIKKRTLNVRKSYDQRMENENEDVNENENRDINTNWETEKLNFQNDWKFKEKFCRDKKIDMAALEQRLDEFISDLELKEEYKPVKELKRHFTNLYNKKNGTGTHQQLSGVSTKTGTSTARTEALKKW